MMMTPHETMASATPSVHAPQRAIPPMRHPFLIGDLVYLRGCEEADMTGPCFQWFNDAETSQHNGHAITPNTMERMRDRLMEAQRGDTIVVFAIIDRTTGVHVGNTSLQGIDWIARSAEIAFLIGHEHGGKGYGSAAGRLVIRYAFERLNLHRVHCGTSAENIGMQKLAAKLGMQREGVRRKAMYKFGKYRDMYEYGILRDEWRQ